MRQKNTAEMFAKLRDLILRTPLPSYVRASSVISTWPEMIGDKTYHGYTLADVVITPRHLMEGDVANLWEQVLWWKIKGGLEPETVRSLVDQLRKRLGSWVAKQIEKATDHEFALVLFLWAVSRTGNFELVYDSTNAWLKLGKTQLGIVNGVLTSVYLQNHLTSCDCHKILKTQFKHSVRNSSAFVIMNMATKAKEDDNGLLKLAYTAVGSGSFNALFRQLKTVDNKSYKSNISSLYQKCCRIVENPASEPIASLRNLLVPSVLSESTFFTLFGKCKKFHIPGNVKRARLLKTINTLFSVESNDND